MASIPTASISDSHNSSYLLISVPIEVPLDPSAKGFKQALEESKQDLVTAMRDKLTVRMELAEVFQAELPEFKAEEFLTCRSGLWTL